MSKHLDVNSRDGHGRWIHTKAYFPDQAFVAASGSSYKLGRFINRGGNGTLFQCFDPKRNLTAVKFLHQIDEQRLDRFQFESLLLEDLDHANILRLHDVGTIETTHEVDVPFIVTDLYDGNLHGHVATKGPLDLKTALSLAIGVCQGLRYIHERGIVHRDMKASNILLKGHDVVIGDFGIATTETDSGVERYIRPEFTVSSELVGPLFWLSPELVAYASNKDTRVDQRSDLYQLGLIIWFSVSGDIVVGGIDPEDDPSGGKLYPIVQKLMKQNPDRRYPDAQAVLSDLEMLQKTL